MILVVGATGFLGNTVCQLLAREGRPLRAVVRPSSNPVLVDALRQVGAELVQADLKDRASLDRACQGVHTVISTATATMRDQAADSLTDVDHQGQLQLVEAAREAGVRHFVYVSYPNSLDGDQPSPLSQAKRGVERHLMESGMTYTILQPVPFMEAWLSPGLGFDYPNARVQVPGEGDRPVGWISLGDVARYVVASLNRPEARNAVLPLVAENRSMNEIIRTFEEATGRPFEVQHIPAEALRAQRDGGGTPLERSFGALMLTVAQGAAVEQDDRQRAFGITPMTVREYAHQVAVPAPAT